MAHAFATQGIKLALADVDADRLADVQRQFKAAGHDVLVFALDYLANAAQVAVFRNAGFLAVVTLRIAFYLVWHVAPSLGLG